MTERITNGDEVVAVIIRPAETGHGIEFFTPGDFPLQVGRISRPQGFEVEPHLHRPLARSVTVTQEVLVVQQGRIRVDFYDDARTLLASRELAAGDVVLLASGGHGLTVLEEARILEVKQGPYLGDNEKMRFASPNRS
jgi:hypothetical protein